jgi:hypothetical protein
MDYREYKPHPFTDMFPLRDGKPLDELVESIRDQGQLEEIVSTGTSAPVRPTAFPHSNSAWPSTCTAAT